MLEMALCSLNGNPQFPAPVSGDDQSIIWDVRDIADFEALRTIANGWITTASLPSFDFTFAAANQTGKRGWSAREMAYHAPAPA